MAMRTAPAIALIALAALTGQALIAPSAAQSPSADPPPMKAEDTPQTTPQTPPAQRPPREMQQRTGPEQQVQQPDAQQPNAQQPAAQHARRRRRRPRRSGRNRRPARRSARSSSSATATRRRRPAPASAASRSRARARPRSTTRPVLVDGKWNVPGAPVDSQTVPAKFSEGNAALDKRPIMAFPLTLSDEQKQKLVAAIRAAGRARSRRSIPS